MGMGVYNFIRMRIFRLSINIMRKDNVENGNFGVIFEKSSFVVGFCS